MKVFVICLIISFKSLFATFPFVSFNNQPEVPFWHLYSDTLGLCKRKDVLQYKSVAWYFSLWDLVESKGKNITVVIVDDFEKEIPFNEKFNHQFLSYLQKVDKKKLQQLPLEQIFKDCNSAKYKFVKNIKNSQQHGIVTFHLIKQLAPFVRIIPIRLLDKTEKGLYEALKLAKNSNPDILHLGLKVNNDFSPLHKKIKKIIKRFPYVVASSGNDALIEKEESFPANSSEVFFDVGAFDNKNEVCEFSQFQKGVGPLFVCPGDNIMYPTLTSKQDFTISKLSGTSTAAALMTGFLSLVLSEFRNNFSDEQIKFVIEQCTHKLTNSTSWKQRVVKGAIDMREVLLACCVLSKMQLMLSRKEFKENFATITKALLRIMSNKLIVNFFGKFERGEVFVKRIKFYAQESFFNQVSLTLVLLIAELCNLDTLKERFLMKEIDIDASILLKSIIESGCYERGSDSVL